MGMALTENDVWESKSRTNMGVGSRKLKLNSVHMICIYSALMRSLFTDARLKSTSLGIVPNSFKSSSGDSLLVCASVVHTSRGIFLQLWLIKKIITESRATNIHDDTRTIHFLGQKFEKIRRKDHVVPWRETLQGNYRFRSQGPKNKNACRNKNEQVQKHTGNTVPNMITDKT